MADKGDSRYPPPEELTRRKRLEERAAEASHEAARKQALQDTPTLSGLVIWLAKRLKMDAYELARRIPDDTLRRLKYPYMAQAHADGSTTFRSVGIVPGKELIHAPTTPGSKRDEVRGGIEVKR